MRGVPRRAAAAGGAEREGRRLHHRRGLGACRYAARWTWFSEVEPQRHSAAPGDCTPHPARDHRAAALPRRCRAGLPDPVARIRRRLSGGESQRIRLASQIGSGLTGVLYVLDEPSIGLHQRDNERLLGTLERLKRLGNTVLVVEHDEDAIRAADYLIDMGPARRREWRLRDRQRHPGRGRQAHRQPHRRLSLRPQAHRGPGAAPCLIDKKPPAQSDRRHRQQFQGGHRITSRSAHSPVSPACPAAANPRWWWIRCTRRRHAG